MDSRQLWLRFDQRVSAVLSRVAAGKDVAPADAWRFEGWCEALVESGDMTAEDQVKRLSQLAGDLLGEDAGRRYAELSAPSILPMMAAAPVWPST